MKEKKYY